MPYVRCNDFVEWLTVEIPSIGDDALSGRLAISESMFWRASDGQLDWNLLTRMNLPLASCRP
jgi:hypothetical protein